MNIAQLAETYDERKPAIVCSIMFLIIVTSITLVPESITHYYPDGSSHSEFIMTINDKVLWITVLSMLDLILAIVWNEARRLG